MEIQPGVQVDHPGLILLLPVGRRGRSAFVSVTPAGDTGGTTGPDDNAGCAVPPENKENEFVSVDAYSVKQKKWITVSTANHVTADVAKSLLDSLEEHQSEKEAFLKKQADLEKDNQRLEQQLAHVSLIMVRSLAIERADLHARVLRIDQRILALGFDPETVIRKYAGLPEAAKEAGK